jgi:CRISPR-associated endonuclease Csn1
LTFEKDPNQELLGFIGRNIADTSYAITTFLHILQVHFKGKCSIVTLNGRLIDYCRKKLFKIYKDRNFYIHHAIDATILGYVSGESKLMELLRWILKHPNQINSSEYVEKIIDHKTGEVIFDISREQEKIHKIYSKDFFKNNPPKFSRMLYKKRNMQNIQFFNETLYSAKIKDGKLFKIKKLDLLSSN